MRQGELTAAAALNGSPGAEEGDRPGRVLEEALAVASSEGRAALAAAIDFAGQALSPATLRAYRSDWQNFCQCCRSVGWSPLPEEPFTVAAYLAALSSTQRAGAPARRA